MKITELSPDQFDSVFELLSEAKLDFSDLKQPNIRLFRFEENGQTMGVGGLEVFNDHALLRSVAVKKELQGKGLGKEIVAKMEEVARQSGIQSFFLLTTTATHFFSSLGYQKISRDNFAESLQQTTQFAGLCPVSAVCMTKQIYET
ncbi:MAG: GNAT family N-acetyltransferase [Prolixibacteraceae bacterium]|nr:GNAT family N-acetyltransferase [Prolixibacteraceae bacterium]